MLISKTARQQTGFTIVELLIVIVVIAVLAAISIVVYNGIQHRANMVRIKTGAETYAKLLDMYRVDHGNYPDSPTGGNWFCLGQASDYPANSDFAAGECTSSSSGIEYEYQPAIATTLAPYANNLPSLSGPTIDDGNGNKYRGVMIDYGNNPTGTFVQVAFALPGGESCDPFEEWYADGSYSYCGQLLRTVSK